MKKRVISLMLLTSLLATAMVGCGKENTENKDSSEKEVSVDASGDNSESEEEEKEPVTLSILGVDRTSDGVMTSDGEKGWRGSLAGKQMVEDLEELGIVIENKWVMFDNNTYKQTLATRVGTGVDVADIIYVEAFEQNVNTWGEYGFVQDILPLLEKYDEDDSIRQFFYDNGAGDLWERCIYDGKLFYLPSIDSHPNNKVTSDGESAAWYNGGSFFIRKDWVEALGYEIKEIYTPDEILDLVIEMREKDANGDGLKNEYIYAKCMDSDYAGIAMAFRLNPYGLGFATSLDNTEVHYVFNFESEYYDDYVDWLQRALEAGVYDSNYLAGIFDRDQKACAVGFENGWGLLSSTRYQEGENTDLVGWRYDYVPVIIDVEGDYDGAYTLRTATVPTGGLNYCISTKCENLEAAIRYMDYVYTYDFALLSTQGVEGEGYTFNEDGTIQGIDDRSSHEGMHKTLGISLLDGMFVPGNAGIFKSRLTTDLHAGKDPATLTPKELHDGAIWRNVYARSIKTFTEYGPKMYSVVVENGPTGTAEEADILLTYQTALSTAMSEYNVKFILGDLSVEDDLDDVLKELYDNYNLQEVIDTRKNIMSQKYTVVE